MIDFTVITENPDYLGIMATIIAHKLGLRKHMYLYKVDTYAKAHASVEANEQQQFISRC
jgi:hypothetical protein